MMRKITRQGLITAMMLVVVLATGLWQPVPAGTVEANPGTNWNAFYYNNATLSGDPVFNRVDSEINFNWGQGAPPGVPVGADNFSVRWTKTVNFPTSGQWTFRVGADDGIRMWIDVTQIVDEWHGNAEGYRTYEVTLDALTAGNHDLKVEYYEATGNAGVKVEWWAGAGGGGTPSGTTGETGAANWNATFYNNLDFSGGAVLTRTDTDINFNWGTNSPGAGVNADNFSARWTATVNFPQPGYWKFRATVDDGVRMWIDVTQIIDQWHGSATGTATYEADVYSLTAGNHDLKVEYFDATAGAEIQVRWQYIGGGAGGGGTAGETIAPPPPPEPPAVVYAAVTGDRVNVRTGPGRGYPAITKVYYPDNYLVLGGVPDLSWLLIELDPGVEGWVSNEWVWLWSTDEEKNQDTTGGGQPDFVDEIPRIGTDIAPPAIPPEGPPRRILDGYATDTVRFRDGPSLYASNIIGSVPQGATFKVEAHNGNGAWYLINYLDIRGWISAPYVVLTNGTVSELVVSSEVVDVPPFGTVFVPETETGELVTVRGRAKSNLRLRDAASLQGKQIASVPQYAEFLILGRSRSGSWFLIEFEGQEGWVNSPYVQLLEGTVSDLPIR
jgi:uncharacterized protein YgiM (DUF1202 family)